jgi:hypothetical protein
MVGLVTGSGFGGEAEDPIMSGLCNDCGIHPGSILFTQDIVPVIDFYTRRIISEFHRVTYRRCSSCQAIEDQRSRDYADLIQAGRPLMMRSAP